MDLTPNKFADIFYLFTQTTDLFKQTTALLFNCSWSISWYFLKGHRKLIYESETSFEKVSQLKNEYVNFFLEVNILLIDNLGNELYS